MIVFIMDSRVYFGVILLVLVNCRVVSYTVNAMAPWITTKSSSSLNALKYVPIGNDGARKLVDIEAPTGKLLDPTKEDMKELAFMLNNITQALDKEPEKAFTIASTRMGWCFQRNVPQIAQMLLDQYPELRKDMGMMKAYMFLLDFLEAVSKETGTMLSANQNTLRTLLEAAKQGESELSESIKTNAGLCCKEEFLVYLDTEIESQESASTLEVLLVALRLRILEEMGQSLGKDVTIIPKLASLSDPEELRNSTFAHLETYTTVGGVELFLQALKMMIKETKKRYKDVDASLLVTLKQIEELTVEKVAAMNRDDD